MPDPVIIAPYDPAWPTMYKAERDRIDHAFGDIMGEIEHFGSTAVPGLPAKPIIDIMIGLQTMEDAGEGIRRLEGIGYIYDTKFGEPPEWRVLTLDINGRRFSHVHIIQWGSDMWERQILFRDHLRKHAGVAGAYECAKRALAGRYRNDREAYTEAKTAFIEAAVEEARKERQASR